MVIPYPVGLDPRHTSPLIPCTSWTVCRTPIRRILRDPVRRTVYRAWSDRQLIRPFVPLSRIVYQYNVISSIKSEPHMLRFHQDEDSTPFHVGKPLGRCGEETRKKEKIKCRSELSTSA